MSEAEDLAIFLSWCDTLTSSLSKYSTLVLPSNFAPWHLMTPNGSLDHKGIPQPPQSQPEIARRAAPPAMIASPNTDAAPAASDSGTHPEPNSNPERTDG
jgi:hypothetical protein